MFEYQFLKFAHQTYIILTIIIIIVGKICSYQ